MTMATLERVRRILRVLLAAVFVAAGVFHILIPATFLRVTPAWVPFAPQVIFLTGVCELFGAAGLLLRRWRWWAGVMLAAYCVCVYPANIQHALLFVRNGTPPGWGYHAPRLAFQPVFVWWCLFAGGVIDWPWRGLRNRIPAA